MIIKPTDILFTTVCPDERFAPEDVVLWNHNLYSYHIRSDAMELWRRDSNGMLIVYVFRYVYAERRELSDCFPFLGYKIDAHYNGASYMGFNERD